MYTGTGTAYGIDSIYPITLDVVGKQTIVVPAIQYDHVARRIRATVMDNKRIINIEDAEAYFYCKKRDGHIIYNVAEVVDVEKGYVDMILTQQALAIAGDQEGILVLKQDGKILQSYTFIVRVEPSIYDEAAVLSTSEYTIFEEKLAQATEAIKDLRKEFSGRVIKYDTLVGSWVENDTAYTEFKVYELEIDHTFNSEKVVADFYALENGQYHRHTIDVVVVSDSKFKIMIDTPMEGYVVAHLGYDI